MELHITKKGDKKINLKEQKPQNNNHAIDIHVHFGLLGQYGGFYSNKVHF